MINLNLYQYDTTGRARFWRGELAGNKYRFVSGLVDGKAVTSNWTVISEGKNIGKSNETTVDEQAKSELGSHYQKRIDSGYSLNLDTSGAKFFEPMLAHSWDKLKDKDKIFPCYSQPKLDGIRCIAMSSGLWTRNGKKIISCTHIEKALEQFFNIYPDAILDGELYNHTLHDDFNKIASLVRKEKDISIFEQMEIEELVEYHVYDYPLLGDQGFGVRNEFLNEVLLILSDKIKYVETESVSSQEELDKLYARYLEDGYEGQMVRYNKPYENKRSKSLIKRKEFQDAEFKILRLEEGLGNWSGYIKSVIVELPDGRENRANLRGNQEYCKKLLTEKDDYVGGQATIRFFNYTPDGIMRFPVAVSLYKKGETRS